MEQILLKGIFMLFMCLSPLRSIPSEIEFIDNDLKLSPSSFRKTYFFMETLTSPIDFSTVFCTITEFLETGAINKIQKLRLSTIIENNREGIISHTTKNYYNGLVSIDRAGYLKPGHYRLSFYTKDSLGNKTPLNAKNIIHVEPYDPYHHEDIPCTFHIKHLRSLKEQLLRLAFYAGVLIVGTQCLKKIYQKIAKTLIIKQQYNINDIVDNLEWDDGLLERAKNALPKKGLLRDVFQKNVIDTKEGTIAQRVKRFFADQENEESMKGHNAISKNLEKSIQKEQEDLLIFLKKEPKKILQIPKNVKDKPAPPAPANGTISDDEHKDNLLTFLDTVGTAEWTENGEAKGKRFFAFCKTKGIDAMELALQQGSVSATSPVPVLEELEQQIRKAFKQGLQLLPEFEEYDKNFVAQPNNPNSPPTTPPPTTPTPPAVVLPPMPTVISDKQHRNNLAALKIKVMPWDQNKINACMEYCERSDINILIPKDKKGYFVERFETLFGGLEGWFFSSTNLRQMTQQLLDIIPQFEAGYKPKN